jgi:hypothetical protein
MVENGRIPWIKLEVPTGLIRVSRSDEHGRPQATGSYWTLLREGRDVPLA